MKRTAFKPKATPSPAQDRDVLYGFFYCSCAYESGYVLQSLHLTKKGAYKAMMKHKTDIFINHRNPDETGMHMDRDYWRWYWKTDPMKDQAWSVKAVEVFE